VDKEAFLAVSLPTEPLEISYCTVQVRGMSREEALTQLAPCPESDSEAMVIHLCMTDPKLTFEEAKGWAAKAPSNDVKAVFQKAIELSGGAPGQNLERPFRQG
jgi:hypothetical protein